MNTDRERLLELLRDRSFEKRPVTLASGKESDWFLDCKQTVLGAEGHTLAGTLLYEALLGGKSPVKAVAGVALGGCPLASAVAMVSFARGSPVDALYIRKEAKGHGSQRLIEGDDRLSRGTPVAILEDVVTSGGSTLRAIDALRQCAFNVTGVFALVDREEGGRETLEASGVRFEALYTRANFVTT